MNERHESHKQTSQPTLLELKGPNNLVDKEVFRKRYPRAGFIGQFATGKDTTATLLGYPWIVKFASPLYALARQLFPGFDKGSPGGRKLLQTLGAWGRGEVSNDYPLTVERGLALEWVREQIQGRFLLPRWGAYGTSSDFWRDIALDVLENDSLPAAVTDARYPNEVEGLWERFQAPTFLVVCHPDTLAARRRGLGYEARDANDSSERLVNNLVATLNEGPSGFDILRSLPWFGGVIWADNWQTCPPYAVVVHPENVVNFGDPV